MRRSASAPRGTAFAAAIGTLALASVPVGYAAFALLAPLPAAIPVVQPLPEFATTEPEVTLPNYGAAAIGAADDDRIFAAVDLDTPRPIASITKIITALVVLDAHPIAEGQAGETLTLTSADAQLPARYAAMGGTIATAPAGLAISQRQVIELMMVHSANNYAETLAVWGFGSVENYLDAARTWLDRHDLAEISVADTTGFSPLNTASPRDLLDLARIADDDLVVSASAALPRVSVPGVGEYANRNRVLGVDGVTGLKTGTLDEAGACLLFSAEHEVDGELVDVVGVVLNGPDHTRVAADVRALLSSIRDDFHPVTVATQDDVVAVYETPWGESITLRVAETVDDVVWGRVDSIAYLSAPPVNAGIDPPATARLTVRYADRVTDVPLLWSAELQGPDLEWRLLRPLAELFGG